jgi:hypothetical protein
MTLPCLAIFHVALDHIDRVPEERLDLLNRRICCVAATLVKEGKDALASSSVAARAVNVMLGYEVINATYTHAYALLPFNIEPNNYASHHHFQSAV